MKILKTYLLFSLTTLFLILMPHLALADDAGLLLFMEIIKGVAPDAVASKKEVIKDKKTETEAEKIIRISQSVIIEGGAKKGKKVTFESVYNRKAINQWAVIITYNIKINDNDALISIAYKQEGDKVWFSKGIKWDNLDEYQMKSSKRQLAKIFLDIVRFDVGPVDEDTPDTPQKTPPSENESQSQPVAASSTTAPSNPAAPPQ